MTNVSFRLEISNKVIIRVVKAIQFPHINYSTSQTGCLNANCMDVTENR